MPDTSWISVSSMGPSTTTTTFASPFRDGDVLFIQGRDPNFYVCRNNEWIVIDRTTDNSIQPRNHMEENFFEENI